MKIQKMIKNLWKTVLLKLLPINDKLSFSKKKSKFKKRFKLIIFRTWRDLSKKKSY